MNKLALIGVLAAALGSAAYAEDMKDKKAEAQQDVQKAQAEASKDTAEVKADAQKETAQAQAKADEKVQEAKKDAHEKTQDAQSQGTASSGADRNTDPAGSGMRDDVRATNEAGDNARGVNQPGSAHAGMTGGKHPVFTKDNFDIEGTIQSASKNAITLKREELPAAKLTLDRNTQIELDGQKVSAMQLKPGQEVKASFNLQNDKPMAVEIKAEKANK